MTDMEVEKQGQVVEYGSLAEFSFDFPVYIIRAGRVLWTMHGMKGGETVYIHKSRNVAVKQGPTNRPSDHR